MSAGSNSSYSQVGPTPKDPIAGINNFLNKQFGVPLAKPKPLAVPQAPSGMGSANASMVPQGSSPGLLPGVNSSSQQKKTTVDVQGNTTTVHPAAPNKNVLAQQQALNKLGAGLVEDGIAGPKTSAAIAKYANQGGSTTTSTSPSATSTPKASVTPPPAPTPPPPAPLTTAGQIPGLLQAGQVTPWEQEARDGGYVDRAVSDLSKFQKGTADKIADIKSQPIPLEFQQGRAQVVQQASAEKEKALQQGVANALANQGQQLGAAGTQAGRGLSAGATALGAVAPQFPSYGSQIIQPGLLGQSGGGSGGGLQDAVSNVVERLQNGTMSYNDAVQALSGYGQGGLNALQQALPPGFNVAQSNTLAGQQGSVNVNYQLADTALNNVESILKQLGVAQTTNIPAINKVANWFSTQFGVGSEATRAMTGAVQSLRNSYASLLASVKGGTPTDYSSQAMSEIPAEPTPNDIAAIRKNFETLGKARKDILGNPGNAGASSGSAGGFAETW